MSYRPTLSATNDGRQGTILDTLGLNKLNFDTLHHDVRRNLTKVDPRLTEDLKNITLLLKEEKNILSSLQNVAHERREVSKHIFVWGKEDNSEDIADITEKLANLLEKIADAETVLCEKYDHYRNLLKEIREADQRLHTPKERRRKVNEEISRLMKSHPGSPRIQELQNDLQRINTVSTVDELEVGNIKRQKLKEALMIQMNAIFETAEKIAIITGFGLYLLEYINTTPAKVGEPRPKYDSFNATQEVVKECQIALHRWQSPSTDIKELLPALTNTAPAQLAAQKQEYEEKIAQIQSTMTSQRQASDDQIAELLKKLADQKKTFEDQIVELTTTFATQKEAYESQINDLSDSVSTQKHFYEVQLNDLGSALAAQREESGTKISELESKNQQFQMQIQQFEAKISELTAALNSEKEKNETQLKEHNVILSQKQEYEIQIREKDALITKLQNEMNSVATEKGKLSQLVKDLEETLKSKTSTLDQKEEKIGRLEDDISSIKSQLAGLKLTPSPPIPSNEGAGPSSNRSAVSGAGPTAASPPRSSASVDVAAVSTEQQDGLSRAPSVAQHMGPPFQQQPLYVAPGPGYQPQGGYVGQNVSPLPNQAGGFVGGFFLNEQIDEAPPAYDGPPKDGFPGDEKRNEKS
ncbi:9384_t:CDS:2 [Ambispora leptoticha]|uniref:9384_t:CDS:1 n=1 Tax=Ambispora leptoticha TaxID=144679 RepID=A0A9N9CF57_9GLOM|nr:9384_t:CDS:2 [Ambispora leptoticha]